MVVTGAARPQSAYGRGTEALLSGVLSGRARLRARPAVRRQRAPGPRRGGHAGLTRPARRGDPRRPRGVRRRRPVARPTAPAARCSSPSTATRRSPRAAEADQPALGPEAFTAAVAGGCGLAEQDIRCYMSACVAASTAIADAAAIIARGQADRVVVAGGYLVEPRPVRAVRRRPRARRRRPGAPVQRRAARAAARRRRRRRRDRVAGVRAGAAGAAAGAAGWLGPQRRRLPPVPAAPGGPRPGAGDHGRAAAGRPRAGPISATSTRTGRAPATSDPAEANALRLALGDAAGDRAGQLHQVAARPGPGGVRRAGADRHAAGGRARACSRSTPGSSAPTTDAASASCSARRWPPTPEFAMSLNAAFGGANTALVVGLP